MFDGNDLPHELLLTTRQKTKLRNAFNNNTSADIKLSKVQIAKIIQSGGFLGSLLSKLAGFNILLKGVTKTIEDETKKQKGRFLSMLLGALGASLLGNLLSEKELVQEKELQELVMVIIHKIKWIFNAASSFNKHWNTKIL